MNRDTATRRVRQIRGDAEARRHHFRERAALRGELGSKRLEEAADRLDRDVEFLETLAAGLDRAKGSTTVDELLAGVEGAAPTTVFNV